MKRLNILLAAFAFALVASAQKVTVSSQVKSTGGEPVKGAIVSIIGAKGSALTDEQGKFALDTEEGEALVSIKAEGYYALELPLSYFKKKEGRNVTVTLIPQNARYISAKTAGKEQKDFNEKQSVGAAIGDAITGLQVIEKSGMPNEGTYMNIRGVHSFVADNSPLVVINGVPYLGNKDVSSVINAYSRDHLFGYDPKDIRSVKVLKAADAGKWGSLGSNGVVEIETQQATSDNLNTRMTFSGSYGLNIAKKSVPVLSATQYKNYMKDIGLTRYPTMEALTGDYPFLLNGSYPQSYIFNENSDFVKDINRNGFVTENVFRVEGGDEIAKYNISFGYTGNRGTLESTATDRYHTLISADVLASKKVDIFANIGLAYITSTLQNTGMLMQTNPLMAAYHTMPLISSYKKQTDGQQLPNLAEYNFWNTSSTPLFPYDNVSNSRAIVETVEGTDKIYDVNTQVGINYKWNNYLTLTGLLNLYYNYTEETMFIPGVTSPTIMPQLYGFGKNKVGNGVIIQNINNYAIQAKYSRIFNKVHEFNGFLGWRMITNNFKADINEGYNTANDETKTLNMTQDAQRSYGGKSEWNYMGYTFTADYTYNRLLRADFSMAMDGTSVSGYLHDRWAFFPSASLTAMFANTGALPDFVNTLDLTVGGSMTGNSRFSSNYGKKYYSGGTYLAIGTLYRENVPNTYLGWENKTQLDLGLNISAFKHRVTLGLNFFTSHAYDLLINSKVSSVYGSREYYENTGAINTTGWEASLRINPYHSKNFDVILGATLSTASSKICDLGEANELTVSYENYDNDDVMMINRVGEKPYEFYGYETKGVYATTAEANAAGLVNAAGNAYQAGDVHFVDQNGDGVINAEDKVLLGSSLPTMYGGFNIALRVMKFVLEADFGYVLGNKVYNATRRQLESMDNFYNQSTAVLNRWQVEGQQTNMPRATYGDPIGNNDFSGRWIEKGDYLKLRSVKLSYNFNKIRSFIRSGNIYVCAENLFTLTKYLGSDPEFAYSYDEALRGFDYAKIALPLTVKIGFNINF